MKTDLYVHNHFWATIDIPDDSLLALLAKGMITRAQEQAERLRADLGTIDGIQCSIYLRFKEPTVYTPATGPQNLSDVAP